MIKAIILTLCGAGIVSVIAICQPVQTLIPNAIEVTAGPIAFHAFPTGIVTGVSETQELSISLHSDAGPLLKIKF